MSEESVVISSTVHLLVARTQLVPTSIPDANVEVSDLTCVDFVLIRDARQHSRLNERHTELAQSNRKALQTGTINKQFGKYCKCE